MAVSRSDEEFSRFLWIVVIDDVFGCVSGHTGGQYSLGRHKLVSIHLLNDLVFVEGAGDSLPHAKVGERLGCAVHPVEHEAQTGLTNELVPAFSGDLFLNTLEKGRFLETTRKELLGDLLGLSSRVNGIDDLFQVRGAFKIVRVGREHNAIALEGVE